MVVHDPQPDTVLTVILQDIDVKYQLRISRRDHQIQLLKVLFQLGVLFLWHIADDLQLLVRITGNDTGADCRCHAMKAPGIGYHHAFHILDNVAADKKPHLVRHRPQHLPGFGRRIGQSDGLGTTHGRSQLFL